MKLAALFVLLGAFSSTLGGYVVLRENGLPVRASFIDAHNLCVAKGMILATPDTKAKNDALLALVKANVLTYVFISANDLVTENIFEWMTTGKPVTNTNVWHSDAPNNFQDEDCVEIDHLHHEPAWNDVQCIYYTAIVCETASDEAVALAKSRTPILQEAYARKYGKMA